MALSGNSRQCLATALASSSAATEITTMLNASVASSATVIAAIGTTTNLLAVPASFADATAVKTFLDNAAGWTLIESRLDVIEAKVDALIAALKVAGLMASS